MRLPAQITGVSIVGVGNFNPLIFQPGWFKEKQIIIGSDLDGLKIEVIHSEIVSFRLPWGQMHVDRERFMISAIQDPIVRAFDFFVGCFEKLPETPFRFLGINRDVHFDAGSANAADRVGDTLAPKQFWSDFVSQDGKKFGGLRTLVMEQKSQDGLRLDGLKGWIRVQIEPSLRIPNSGIYVQVNDHFDMSDGDNLSDGLRATELVAQKWKPSIAASEAMIDRIMGLAQDAI